MIHKYKIAYIEWEDSESGRQGWKSIEDSITPLTHCISCGFIVYTTKTSIIVTSHLAPLSDDTVDIQGDLTIPRSAIKSITYLKLPKIVKK